MILKNRKLIAMSVIKLFISFITVNQVEGNIMNGFVQTVNYTVAFNNVILDAATRKNISNYLLLNIR